MTKINIIMGFLGVGKTTAILSLLKQKPADEKWAVLVNEFGEVGIDGAIITAESQNPDIAIKEIPGGCLCCVSGLPFQMALGMLIAKEKPDRILIEPTGLGHPRNLLRTLSSDDYKGILEIAASICLVDPRQLADPRYQSNETFNDQCSMADVLVANKTDLCDVSDKDRFEQFLAAQHPKKLASGWTQQGQLDAAWLLLASNRERPNQTSHHHHSHGTPALATLAEGEAYSMFENHGMGHYSVGWLFAENQVFNEKKILDWLGSLDLERIKGLVITEQGTRVVNMKNQVLTHMPTRSLQQSRLEFIHSEELQSDILQGELLACLEAGE